MMMQSSLLQQRSTPQAVCFTSRASCPPRALNQVHRNRSQEVGPSQRCVTVHAAAADDAIDVTSKNLDDALSQVKTGVARLRGVRGSPFKFRRVLDQIRGRTYEDALRILEYLPYRAREDILTTLLSAAANAKNNEGALKKKLLVYECYADDAGMYKRFQPRAKGRPFPIHVKKSHITIKVVET